MFRALAWVVVVAIVIYFGTTVELGKKTLWGHVRAIWATEEMQDMKAGIEEKAGPMVERAKRGIEAGVEAAKEPAPLPDAAVLRAPGSGTSPVPPTTPTPKSQ